MDSNVIRKAFVMSIYPGFHQEYKKRHDEIWPELTNCLKNHGVSRYSIFLDETTNNLFAYVEVLDEKIWNRISETEICKEWWIYMKDIMKTNEDNSPVSTELKDVFFME